MPFIVPFLPAIIEAAGSIGGALLGGKGGSSTKDESGQINTLLTDVQGRSDQQAKFGKQDRKQFRNALDPVSQFFQQILGGDRTAISSVLGPEVEATGKQFDAVSKAISQFAPRGGGRNTALAGAEFEKAAKISDLYAKARPAAAQGLETVAGLYGSQATSEGATAMGGLSTALSGLLGLRQQDIQKMLANQQFAGGIGQSLGRLLASVLNKGGDKTGSSGGTGSNPFLSGGLELGDIAP